MILTVTMNPSVDISYPLEFLKIDSVNRVSTVTKEAGGKGLNVTKVIKQANEEVVATGLIGGTVGDLIINKLNQLNIKHDFARISQESRNCIAILHTGYQTEILEEGPTISLTEKEEFIQTFSILIDSASTVTISGSLPSGIEKDFYQKLIRLANKKGKKVLLDCSGECLELAAKGPERPYLIKPNKEEIEQLTGKKLHKDSIECLIDIVKKNEGLQRIPWIVVSLGKNGALAKIDDCYYTVKIPEIKAINPVGSGDATIAGLAVGINKMDNHVDILKRAMVFGMLNAMEAKTGHINMALYDRLFNETHILPYHPI